MKYEEMNEHELNITLTALVNSCENYNVVDKNQNLLDCDFISGQDKHYEVADYCHDWNVTMPLAIDHKIALIPTGRFDVWCAIHKPYIDLNNQIHANILEYEAHPLRAIVICLIKVLESN